MNKETMNAGPLERRVGRVDGETTPKTQGFASYPLLMYCLSNHA